MNAQRPAGPGASASCCYPPLRRGQRTPAVVPPKALAVLRDALGRCAVEGVTTNLGLHRALLADPEFGAGGVDTGYLTRWLAGAADAEHSSVRDDHD